MGLLLSMGRNFIIGEGDAVGFRRRFRSGLSNSIRRHGRIVSWRSGRNITGSLESRNGVLILGSKLLGGLLELIDTIANGIQLGILGFIVFLVIEFLHVIDGIVDRLDLVVVRRFFLIAFRRVESTGEAVAKVAGSAGAREGSRSCLCA